MNMRGSGVRAISMLFSLALIVQLFDGQNACLFIPSSYYSTTSYICTSVSNGACTPDCAFAISLDGVDRTRGRTTMPNTYLPDRAITKKRTKVERSMMLTNNINDRKSDGRDISSTYDGMQGGENSIRAPKRRQSVILYSKRIDESDNDNGNQNTYDNATNSSSIDETIVKEEKQETKKPMSRLAMAAADWLEEDNDDYDELSNYWNKFEEAKNNKNEKCITIKRSNIIVIVHIFSI